MGILFSKGGSAISDRFTLVEGIRDVPAGTTVEMALYDDHFEVSAPEGGMSVRYSQVEDVFYGNVDEVLDVRGHPLRGAILGGMFLGTPGAIAGTALGSRTRRRTFRRTALIVKCATHPGSDRFVCLADERPWHAADLAAELRELCGIPR